ncbi:MAG: hypothetical protein JW841_17935 [Deltaproteobacteria bacterium]|nr:hypothetical protein [Deltaproteobacteria bacterium]
MIYKSIIFIFIILISPFTIAAPLQPTTKQDNPTGAKITREGSARRLLLRRLGKGWKISVRTASCASVCTSGVIFSGENQKMRIPKAEINPLSNANFAHFTYCLCPFALAKPNQMAQPAYPELNLESETVRAYGYADIPETPQGKKVLSILHEELGLRWGAANSVGLHCRIEIQANKVHRKKSIPLKLFIHNISDKSVNVVDTINQPNGAGFTISLEDHEIDATYAASAAKYILLESGQTYSREIAIAKYEPQPPDDSKYGKAKKFEIYTTYSTQPKLSNGDLPNDVISCPPISFILR